MTFRRVATLVFWAAALGLVLAALQGEAQVISLEIWLAGFSSWLAVVLFLQLLSVSPTALRPSLGLWRFGREPSTKMGDPRPRDLRSAESLLIRARDNERVLALQLRPRLVALAEHYLPVHHGIDLTREPQKANEILGDSAWLIDPGARGRVPTLAEIEHLIDTVAPSQNASTTSTPTPTVSR